MNVQPVTTPPVLDAAALAPPARDAGAAARSAQAANAAGNGAPVLATQPVAAAPTADSAQLQAAVEDVRKFVEPITQNLEFAIDDDTGRTVIKIIDRQTDEVLRQIPSEEMLQIAQALGKLQGLFVQQKA